METQVCVGVDAVAGTVEAASGQYRDTEGGYGDEWEEVRALTQWCLLMYVLPIDPVVSSMMMMIGSMLQVKGLYVHALDWCCWKRCWCWRDSS